MYCSNHPMNPATGVCSRCGKAICQNCGVLEDGQLVCKACAQNMPVSPASQGNNAAAGAGAPVQNKKSSGALPIVLLIAGVFVIGLILAVVATIVLAAVIAAFVFGTVGTVHHTAIPTFTATKNADSTYTITLQDTGGASSIKGLWVQSPYVSQPTLVDQDTSMYVGQSVTFSDPDISGPVHLILMSNVDGKDEVVMDTYE